MLPVVVIVEIIVVSVIIIRLPTVTGSVPIRTSATIVVTTIISRLSVPIAIIVVPQTVWC